MTSDGAEISDSEERGKFIGWLGHHDAAKPQLTPRETLRFFCDLNGVFEGIDDALDAVGLGRARDLPCQYLSAGQKKRLALARLKLSHRPLWLLDEPLAALDAGGKSLAAQIVKDHCASGGIAIAATHEPLGLDTARLEKDMQSDEIKATLEENAKLARDLALSGTPSYIIGKDVVVGAVGMAALDDQIKAARIH